MSSKNSNRNIRNKLETFKMENDGEFNTEIKIQDRNELLIIKQNLNTVIDNLKKLGLYNLCLEQNHIQQHKTNTLNNNMENPSKNQPIIQFHNNNTIQKTNNNIITELKPDNHRHKTQSKDNQDFLRNKKQRIKDKKPLRKSLAIYKSDDSDGSDNENSSSPSITPRKKTILIHKNNKKTNYEIDMLDMDLSKEEEKVVVQNEKEKVSSKNIQQNSHKYVSMMKGIKLHDEVKEIKKKVQLKNIKETFPLIKKKKEENDEYLYIKYKEDNCEFTVIYLSPLTFNPEIINIMYFLPISDYFRTFNEEQINLFFSDVSIKLNIKPKELIKDSIIQKLKREQEIAVCQINSCLHFIIHFSAFPNLITTDLIIKELKDQNLHILLSLKNGNNGGNHSNKKEIKLIENKQSKSKMNREDISLRECESKKENIINELRNEIEIYRNKLDSLTNASTEMKKNYFLLESKLNNNNNHFNMIQTQYKEKNEQLTNEKVNLQNDIKSFLEEINLLKDKIKEGNTLNEKNELILSKLNMDYEKNKEDLKIALNDNEFLKEQIKKLNDPKVKIDNYLIEEVKNGSKEITPTSQEEMDDKLSEMKSTCILCCENRRDVLFLGCSHSYCCYTCLKSSYKKKFVKKPKISNNTYYTNKDFICCAICKTDNNTFIKIIYA